jgi:mannose-1-phosphate guanylyltransferase
MINVILCGGSGTRLWPLSRTMLPKQFVRLFNGKSLFQETVIRNAPLCSESIVVTNRDHYFLAIDQLGQTQSNTHSFLLESVGRNTAPAIALACMALDEHDVVLVTSSDHLVRDQAAYEGAVLEAQTIAEQGYLVTFGIKPNYPETGFGYIEASGNNVLSFKEKPSIEAANSYIEQGNYYWNSGMFCFRVGIFLNELEKHASQIYMACKKAMPKDINKEINIELSAMQAIPADSIDYAVMEKSDKVKVVPCDMGWSDLGSFDALYNEVKKEAKINAVLSRLDNSPEPICINSSNNLIVTRDRQVALIDVDDLLIVDTSDAILISKKGSSQKVKEVVAEIKKQAPELAEIHRLAHRPWGTYEVLVDSEGYKVKRIIVKPDSRLSLQKHFHRNEHWVVVSGTATITVEDKRFTLNANESTYIKMGELHRLENEGQIDLVIMEVQVGEYTGEDDIVRVNDAYGR